MSFGVRVLGGEYCNNDLPSVLKSDGPPIRLVPHPTRSNKLSVDVESVEVVA